MLENVAIANQSYWYLKSQLRDTVARDQKARVSRPTRKPSEEAIQ